MPMFPYPSGDSMHVGHASNYIINDFVARYKKMQWFDVIHPMGFDSFGLPTENYAIKTGKSAQQATKDNIVNFKEQIKAINLQFDPEREFATSDPEYYKWTQWIFARLFEHGLAYKKDGLVNRCNGCQTVLANDQVVDGKCERCETVIVQKKHPQRYIKTTALADELIDDLDLVDRPEETKTIQKNWIGRSFGAEIDFKIDNNLTIAVFTTRPDTLYGVTALVLAPENQIIDHLLSSEKVSELANFRAEVAKLTAIDRQSTEREKNGMNSGVFVTHPLTNEAVPVWFADYVLMDYATGAVMMVPAHDERDWEFAKKYGITVKWVIDGWNTKAAYTETWVLINSWQFNWLNNEDAKTAITEYLETLWLGRKKKTFRLRDRSVSRQRYRWSPIPIYYTFEDNKDGKYTAHNPHPDKSKRIPHLIPDEDLPVILPLDLPNYKPAGKSPLEDHPTFKYYEKKEQVWPIFKEIDNWIKLNVTPERAPRSSVWSKNTKTVTAIIEHPTEDKFILVNHRWSDRTIFCGWWIDDGESILEAWIREMTEETWYFDIAEQKVIWENMMLDFFHPTKNINYLNNDNCIYIKLNSLNQKAIDQKELDKLEVVRIERNNVEKSFIWWDGHKFRRNRFIYKWINDEEYITHINNRAYKNTIYLRECDTLDTFMCSSFYFLRYLDPANTNQLISDTAAANMPVDLYIGGKEHAVWHLIYSRFIYKFLQKYGYIHTEAKEPFVKLIHQGMVHAADGRKFSKRRGNGINPLDVVKEHNTDTLRTYLAFMGPIELPKNWNPDGVAGVGRFLKRFEKMMDFVRKSPSPSGAEGGTVGRGPGWGIESTIHQTIKWVTEDMDNLKFNTAISKLMIATNAIYDYHNAPSSSEWSEAKWAIGRGPGWGLQSLILLLAPFAPETAERMWSSLWFEWDITKQPRPTYDPSLIQDQMIHLPIQFNGKTKGTLSVPKDIEQNQVIEYIKQDPKMWLLLAHEPKKIIRIPGKIINIVL